jgi:CubicO group peptidase (beta-lactamase class C family)
MNRGSASGVLVELEDGRQINGIVEHGFGLVLDAFRRNFLDRQELGSGCSIYVQGRLVVDLWGGVADARTMRPWDRDTAAVIFSCTKGVLAICTYRLVQDGLLDLDLPIAHYWPGFSRRGKGAITVRHAMSHRSGLAALDPDFTLSEVLGWDPVVAALENQRPLHNPPMGHMYHAMTYGWLVGQVIRSVTGMRPGEYFQRTIAQPLALRTWIGLPEEARSSVAWMEPPLPDEESDAARRAAEVISAEAMIERSMTMGGAFPFPTEDGLVSFNNSSIQAGEIPGANGISTARSLAKLYAACVSNIDGTRLLLPASIEDALKPLSEGPQLTDLPDDGARWGTGFQLSSPPFHPMLGPFSFGHAGAGGQLAFADPTREVGFAFLSCQMGGYGDRRALALTHGLAAALG